jgi:hypothetical protein
MMVSDRGRRPISVGTQEKQNWSGYVIPTISAPIIKSASISSRSREVRGGDISGSKEADQSKRRKLRLGCEEDKSGEETD